MSSRIPPLPALRAFAAFIRQGSIQAAAEELSLTAGAVSHQIRALEDFLHLPLLEKQGRQLILTEQGRLYGYRIRQALDEISSATYSTAVQRKPSTPVVRLSVLPSWAQGWLLPRLPAFSRRHPQIRLVIQGSMDYADLQTGTVDCAIRFGHGHWVDAVVRPLMSDQLIVVASPKFLGKRQPQSVEQLLRLPLLESQESWSHWLSTLPEPPGQIQRPVARMEFTDSTHMLEAARLGLGIALSPHSIAESLLNRGELVKAFDHECPHTSGYYALLPPSGRPSEPTEAFLTWLQEEGGRYMRHQGKKGGPKASGRS